MKTLIKINADDIGKQKFNGFTISEVTQSTGQDLRSISIVDLDGNVLTLMQSAYSDFAAYMQKPPTKVRSWHVKGTLDGVSVSAKFDCESKASEWQPNLSDRTQVMIEELE